LERQEAEMERDPKGLTRAILIASLGLGLILVLADGAHAELTCGPFYPNGLQLCEVGIDSDVADVEVSATQHLQEWCWAASIEMVFSYYSHPVPQERIVAETWGAVVNLPAQPIQVLGALNRHWTDENGDSFRARGDVFSANATTAAQDLAADRPLIIGTLGHAMVLTGLTYWRNAYGAGQVTAAVVRDPWPGRGKRVLSPQEWYGANFLARIRIEK
jgi:hypothetical protein